MARVRVVRTVDAPAGEVWAVLADLAGHPRWQVDLDAVTFTTKRRRGVGTGYVCATRLGPLRARIPMEVVEWRERRTIAVAYAGSLRGRGRLSVRRRRGRHRTTVVWSASVGLPWWMGGPIGALAAAQLLRAVWRRNLRNLAEAVEPRRNDRNVSPRRRSPA